MVCFEWPPVCLLGSFSDIILLALYTVYHVSTFATLCNWGIEGWVFGLGIHAMQALTGSSVACEDREAGVAGLMSCAEFIARAFKLQIQSSHSPNSNMTARQ